MRLINVLSVLLKASLVAASWLSEGPIQPDGFPLLLDATLDDLRAGLDAGLFTSVDLVNAYIARIDEVNDELRPITELNPDALSIAAELDEQRTSGDGGDKPLHGIPVLVKDNIATNDKMNNTAGSYALLGAKVSEDSTVVAKLRKAGAIILGKTNLSEWAACRSFNTSQGWSAYGGQTVGAYFPGQDPSGSSSGSAVASSLGLAWASLGTETSGSIMHPSHMHNLVGIKPTVGLTSRHLVVPISEHQDTVGPMARTVKDAARLLSAIVGVDEHDNYTSAIPFDETPDYFGACKRSGLEGKRVGVPRNFMAMGFDSTADLLPSEDFDAALDVLRAAGAEVIDDVFLPAVAHILNNSMMASVTGGDFFSDIPKYFHQLETNPQNLTSVEEILNFTQNHGLEEYPERDTSLWEGVLERGYGNDSPEWWTIHTMVQHLAGDLGLTGALKNHSLDALVAPTPYSYLFSAKLGTPVVSVPMARMPDNSPVILNGFGNLNKTAPNQPVGLAFAGAAFSEISLIEMAYAFEQRTMVRNQVKPWIQPKTELVDVIPSGRLPDRNDLKRK